MHRCASARYRHRRAGFAANNGLLLRNLGASAAGPASRTVISLILDGEGTSSEGIVEGHIAQCASGSKTWLRPSLHSKGSAKTYAEMDRQRKSSLARGRAVRKLADFCITREISYLCPAYGNETIPKEENFSLRDRRLHEHYKAILQLLGEDRHAVYSKLPERVAKAMSFLTQG